MLLMGLLNAGDLVHVFPRPGFAGRPAGNDGRWRASVIVLRLLREPELCRAREIFRLEQWREAMDRRLAQCNCKGDPVQAWIAPRIGELTMQVLEAKTETFGPLGRRRSRR